MLPFHVKLTEDPSTGLVYISLHLIWSCSQHISAVHKTQHCSLPVLRLSKLSNGGCGMGIYIPFMLRFICFKIMFHFPSVSFCCLNMSTFNFRMYVAVGNCKQHMRKHHFPEFRVMTLP